jgi:acyl-CoA synthetase (AMP-forming)/AMP-acid ligase II
VRSYNNAMDFATILDGSAREHADRVAVAAAGRSLTFAELADRAARLAGGFAGLGLAPGDRIATLLPKGRPGIMPARVAEIAEKTFARHGKLIHYGECRNANGLKLQGFPHIGRCTLLNGVQEVAGSNPVAPTSQGPA